MPPEPDAIAIAFRIGTPPLELVVCRRLRRPRRLQSTRKLARQGQSRSTVVVSDQKARRQRQRSVSYKAHR
jgi:hypothetical protein